MPRSNGSHRFDPSVSLYLTCEEAPAGNVLRSLLIAMPLCLAFWGVLISLLI